MDARISSGPGGTLAGGSLRRAAGAAARATAVAAALVLGLLIGIGWLYVLRGLGWLGVGPKVHDALPLLQLPGFDVQPLARVAAAWLLAGVAISLALRWIPRSARAVLAGTSGLALLLLASQASYALTRNARFSDVVWSRTPGAGPLAEAVLFAAGCAVLAAKPGGGRPPGMQAGFPRTGALRHLRELRLRSREHRDAAEHQRDREQMR